MTKDSDKFRVSSNRIKRRSLYEVIKDLGLPVIVLVVGLVVTGSQHKIEEKRIKRQNTIETNRIARQESIEKERNQISILNNYRRSISNLIGTTNPKKLWGDPKENESNYSRQVAVAITRSTLPQLDGSKKGNLITYLITLDLLRMEKNDVGHRNAPISLANVNLRDADLRDADLIGADLRDAKLYNANLRDADLRDADLIGANLRDADLTSANLRNADLRNADLRDADLFGTDLRGADLRGAKNVSPVRLILAKNWKSALLDNFIREATLKIGVNKKTK